ncbi:MAG: NAD(P)/FAD-dependent oxidoreductase [Candidatus Thermoplasmatota archaeon]
MKQLSILGGGISGLSAAITLAKAHYDVTVYEKKESYNHCTPHTSVLRNYAIPTSDALQEIKTMGLDITADNHIDHVIKISPNYCSHVHGEKIYYSLRRGNGKTSLEQQLYHIAEKQDVHFNFNSTQIKNPTIIACGHNHIPNIKGYGREYKNVPIKNNTVYLFYDNNIAPHGYLCVIPSKENLTTVLSVVFGSAITFDAQKEMFTKAVHENKILKDLLEDATPQPKPIIGYSFYKKNPLQTCIKKNTLYIGDAGGFQDASRGFGIRYALLTGVFAAQSIISGKSYAKILKDYFKHEFIDNYTRRTVFNTYTNTDYDKMIHDIGEKISRDSYISAKRNNILET